MRTQEDKQVLTDKLMAIQDAETAKAPEAMDTQLVSACSAYILELDGEELPTPQQWEQKQQKLLHRLFGSERKPRRARKILRRLCIAAAFLLLAAALSTASVPLGNSDESLLDRFGYYLQYKLKPGDTIDFGQILLINGGESLHFKNVKEFVRKTEMDILVPTVLPEGHSIQSVSISQNVLIQKQEVSFVTDLPAHLSICCTLDKDVDENYKHSCRRIEKVGQYLCYFAIDPGWNQCNFAYKGNEYIITAESYADLVLIITNMKGSLKK